MSYVKDSKEAGELFIKIATTLRPIYGDKITIVLGDMSISSRQGHYINIRRIETQEGYPVDMHKPHMTAIKNGVKELFEPRYISIKKACIDLIGEKVYSKDDNEWIEWTAIAITKDGIEVESKEGSIKLMNIDELYMKV